MSKAKQECEVAALLRKHRAEAEKCTEVLKIVETDVLDVHAMAPPLRTNEGAPPMGSSPGDLGGVYPQGSDQPPLGVLPDGGPDGARGDLAIMQAAAMLFFHIPHATHDPRHASTFHMPFHNPCHYPRICTHREHDL